MQHVPHPRLQPNIIYTCTLVTIDDQLGKSLNRAHFAEALLTLIDYKL